MPKLSVEGPYEYTDLRILDSQLSEIASGTHRLVVDVSPGIYRTEARVPGAIDERLVSVPEGRDVHVTDFKLSLDSPAPVPEARTYHQSHDHWAASTSHAIHVRVPGQSPGRLFLTVRTDGSPRNGPPGILVMTRDREVLANLNQDGLTEHDSGFYAISLELPAGTYVLAQEESGLGLRGQAVFVEHGWQTQIFAPWDTSDVGLSRALVSMVRQDQGFRSSTSRYEYVEAALDGLASGRVVLTPNEENELLYAKFENPMLGMIGAYAYILRGQIDYHRLGIISRNLLELLPNSPDARLLAILASSPSHDPHLDPWLYNLAQGEFDAPPMFALGTDWLIERAAEDINLIPAPSWVAQLSLVRTTGSVFTRWDMNLDPGQQLRTFGEYVANWHGDDFSPMKEIARAARLPLSVITQGLQKPSEIPPI
jgi:hypothetical protein